MPMYEYICQACAAEFEELKRSFSDATVDTCPSCGGGPVERKFSVFSARSGPSRLAAPAAAPCGRCGDPNGPCSVG